MESRSAGGESRASGGVGKRTTRLREAGLGDPCPATQLRLQSSLGPLSQAHWTVCVNIFSIRVHVSKCMRDFGFSGGPGGIVLVHISRLHA